MPMQGFDPEFRDLPHYIVRITEDIWEKRGVHLIRKYYGAQCRVRTPMGLVVGAEATVAGTLETLHSFPDRRLLAEDIIFSGDPEVGFLSSHRVMSTMHHRGHSVFGPPTGKPIRTRTVADCEVRANMIDEEWLIRDQAAIVAQIGGDVAEFAARLAAADAMAGKASWHLADDGEATWVGGARPMDMRADPLAAVAIDHLDRILNQAELSAVRAAFHTEAVLAVPGGQERFGHDDIDAFLVGYLAAFPGARFTVDHAAVLRGDGRPDRVALRLHMTGTHSGRGGFGAPSGARMLVPAIAHLEFWQDRVLRGWVMIDELALWKQIRSHTG
jgi:predicted ester cyclase